MAARGSTILAATFEETLGGAAVTQTSTGAQYGLYRSTDGGASFSLVSAGSGLGSGPVTSLVADPANDYVRTLLRRARVSEIAIAG